MLGAATKKISVKLVACNEGQHSSFGLTHQQMVGLYACSYVTYSDYHCPAHQPHFALQLHDALAGWSRTAEQLSQESASR